MVEKRETEISSKTREIQKIIQIVSEAENVGGFENDLNLELEIARQEETALLHETVENGKILISLEKEKMNISEKIENRENKFFNF